MGNASIASSDDIKSLFISNGDCFGSIKRLPTDINVVLCGPMYSNKSRLFFQFIEHTNNKYVHCSGVDATIYNTSINDQDYRLFIYDIETGSEFSTASNYYYSAADIILICISSSSDIEKHEMYRLL